MVLAKRVKLTTPQLSLLNRGLNFIPTKGSHKDIKLQSRLDLQDYHRRLKIWAYYGDRGDSEKQPFTPPSSWTPPEVSLPPYVLELTKLHLDYFQKSFEIPRVTPNLTQNEKLALKQLADNQNMIIKPADKGSVVVIMDREQYVWEGHRQLRDKKY